MPMKMQSKGNTQNNRPAAVAVERKGSHDANGNEHPEDASAQRMLEQAAKLGQQLAKLIPNPQNASSSASGTSASPKWVSFGAKCASERDVVDTDGSTSLMKYLALPPEQYSLLDTSLVERLRTSSTEECTAFLVTLPIGSLLGVPDVKAQFIVRASPMPDEQRVLLVAESALGEDEPFEASAQVDLRALSPRWGGKPGTSRLKANAEADVKALVPPPLSSLPRVALKAFASLVANAIAQVLLPRFLELLEADFHAYVQNNSSSNEYADITSNTNGSTADRALAASSNRTDDVGSLAPDNAAAALESKLPDSPSVPEDNMQIGMQDMHADQQHHDNDNAPSTSGEKREQEGADELPAS